MTVPDRNTFESAYAGQAPWDIGKPQKALRKPEIITSRFHRVAGIAV